MIAQLCRMTKSVLVFFAEEIADFTPLNSSAFTKVANTAACPAQSGATAELLESLPVVKFD